MHYGNYCNEHSCKIQHCLNKRYNQKPLCHEHNCISKDCDTIGYSFICYEKCKLKLVPNIQCKKWHNKSGGSENDEMMRLSRIIKIGHEIDHILLWKKINLLPEYVDFSIGFKQTAYSLLHVLRVYGVPKQIRKMIFYEYLLESIQLYFDKCCYKCVKICSKETCGSIGWPYNKECKTHVCLSVNCNKLKYKNFKFCTDHKCKTVTCDKQTYGKMDHCKWHLCPLCRVYGVRGKMNFCKKCRCKKQIQNEHGLARCDNPKYYGDKNKNGFCMDHQ